MILAMLLFTARVVRRRRAGLCLMMLLSGAASIQAQGIDDVSSSLGGGVFTPYRGGSMTSQPLGPATSLTIPARPMGRLPGSAALGLRDGINALRPAGAGTQGGLMPRRHAGPRPFRLPAPRRPMAR